MKLLLDMNLSQLWLPVLHEAGFIAVHWSAIGEAMAADREIMAYARTYGYTICTQDLDFGLMLAASGDAGPSVLQIRAEGVLPNQISIQVIHALRQLDPEQDGNALVTVDPKKTRVKILPLRPRR